MSERKFFGTDGIRGKANVYPMTCEMAMALGRAVTYYFKSQIPRSKQPLIIVGKDTRLSCYMLELAFSSGVCSQGGQVILTGPLPTPGVAFATQSMRANAGVMISASHNAYTDNGIKIFDSNGNKLPDEVELELERMVAHPEQIPIASGSELGNARRLDEVIGRYTVHVKSCFDSNYNLDDFRVVVDCANGAAYKVAPMIFSELGAEVFTLGVNPNGQNINAGCGSLFPQTTQDHVVKYRADLGICLDGDADRVVLVDEKGEVVDGDRLLGLYVKLMMDKNVLRKGDVVVGTVMSNLGLENFVKSLGLRFHRTKVGDRYIIEYINSSGALLGGEPSGHIIFRKYATTGDGILGALKAIECMKFYNRPLGELAKDVKLYPQIVRNATVQRKPPLDQVANIQKELKEVEGKLGDRGRVLLRYSGTEPLARVMVEGEDPKLVDDLCDKLITVVSNELGH